MIPQAGQTRAPSGAFFVKGERNMPNVFLEGLQRPAIKMAESNGGSDLPDITPEDEGKFLSVDQGEAVWEDAPSGLPEIGDSDEGKVLSVVDNSGTLEAQWAAPSGGITYIDTVNVEPVTKTVDGHEFDSSMDMIVANFGEFEMAGYAIFRNAPVVEPVFLKYTNGIQTLTGLVESYYSGTSVQATDTAETNFAVVPGTSVQLCVIDAKTEYPFVYIIIPENAQLEYPTTT